MTGPLLQQNKRRRPTSPSIERHRALQHGVAGLLYAAFAGCILLFGFLWGDIAFADGTTIGSVTSMVANLPLLLAAVDLVAAGYHFVLFKKLHREATEKTLISLRVWDDLDIGERSPAKVAVVFIGVIVLMGGFLALTAVL